MRRGEVWWINFDPSVGGEICKTRPTVIISNNAANEHLNRVQVVPLTSNVDRVYRERNTLGIEKPGKWREQLRYRGENGAKRWA